MGVPLGNCFLNKLEWHAEAIGANQTHLTIKAHTEFIVPVFGVLRSQIEKESLKGITYSYKIFETILKQQRWQSSSSSSPSSTTSTTGTTLTSPPSSTSQSAAITNRKHSSAMATPKAKQKDLLKTKVKVKESIEIPSIDIDVEMENIEVVLYDSTDESIVAEETEEEEDDRKFVEEDEEEEEERLKERPHKITYCQFRTKTFEEIEALATEKWPIWADNRYWLLKSGSHGGSEVVSSCPTPDEAVGIMWAVVSYASSRKPGSRSSQIKAAFFKGLIECLRVTKARTPPKGPIRVLRGGGAALGAGRGGGAKGKRRGKQGKNANDAPDTPTPALAANTLSPSSSSTEVTTTAASTGPPVLSGSSISAAIFCIGFMEAEMKCEWVKELDAVCSLIPMAKFYKVIEVYNVIWSLRACRHWTPHLPILEAAVVALLTELDESKWTRRQLRHASYCAQGLVHFGHVPKQLLPLLAPRLDEKWDWRAACSLSWALTISNELDSVLVPVVFKGIQENSEEALERGFHRHVALSKIWQLVTSLDQMRPGSLSKKGWNPSTKKVIELAEAHWKVLVHEETKITSAVQKEVHRSMLSMGYTADLECAVCGLSIDVAVQEIKLAVEVDGFAHFARNSPNQAVGNSLWKKRFLEANGWIAVNVNVKDWYNKRGAGEKRNFLKAAIEQQEERKKVKDAARLKKKKYWKKSYPTRAKARYLAAKKKRAAAAAAVAAGGGAVVATA